MRLKNKQFGFLLSGLWACGLLVLIAAVSIIYSSRTEASAVTGFVEGEKLTYNVSFDQFKNVAYAEVLVASKGMIGERDAVELVGKVKALNLFSAVFYMFDHSRTVFAATDSGLPLYIKDVSNSKGIPIETNRSYLSTPATELDLLTLLYKVRENGGAGSFSIREQDRTYSVDFAASGGETVKTEAGSFETSVSGVTSSYFTEFGITEVKVYFSSDEKRLPVLVQFRTPKGRIRAELASYSNIRPEKTPETTVTPERTPTPKPTPVPTPTPFLENQPLSPDLPFKIGEKLVYSVRSSGREAGQAEFSVDSRKLLNGEDTLVLKIHGEESAGNTLLLSTDSAEVWVDPFTLAPRKSAIGFSGELAGLNQSVSFEQGTGIAVIGDSSRVDIPIGTHTLHSLIYAIRSFNLRPSKDAKNPINDTRVAVFVNDRPLIFTLRPGELTMIEINKRRVSAQMITIITGDGSIDRFMPKIWLSNDVRRVPLRISYGTFQAELIR